MLDRLIEQALANNRDLLIAAARVDQFIGQLTTTRAQFFPQLGYGADAGRNRASRVGVPALPPGADAYSTLYQGALSAQWQIDLFGRVARQTESAQAQLYASEQGRRGVVLSLVGSVTSTYIGLRGLDRQLEIARATASNYADTKRIFDLRFKGGVVSAVEVEQINSQYEQALAAIPWLEQQIAAQENLIAVLLGRNPGPMARGKTIDELLPPRFPAGLPASLLERRPDILQAEQNLVAANANVGVAQSLYYPQPEPDRCARLGQRRARRFPEPRLVHLGIAAALIGPIFTFGAIEGQVAGAEAAQREAVANYQRVILNAMRETNDALTGSGRSATRPARRRGASRPCANLRGCPSCAGTTATPTTWKCCTRRTSCSRPSCGGAAAGRGDTQIVAVYSAIGGGWVDDAAQRAPLPLGTAPAGARSSPSHGLRLHRDDGPSPRCSSKRVSA